MVDLTPCLLQRRDSHLYSACPGPVPVSSEPTVLGQTCVTLLLSATLSSAHLFNGGVSLGYTSPSGSSGLCFPLQGWWLGNLDSLCSLNSPSHVHGFWGVG